MATVHASYYTDPACPGSWRIEPAVRKLMMAFGADLRFSYVMGGLAREFGPPLQQVGAWLEAGAGGMPVDPRLWLRSGPASSFPACLAVEAAAEQGHAERYLRRLREGFAFSRRRLDTTDALMGAAREVETLNLERFEIDLQSNAMVERFSADLERAAAVDEAHHAPGTGRVRLPSIEFSSDDGAVHGVYGPRPYEEYAGAAQAAGAKPLPQAAPDIETALRRFGAMATVEVAAVCDLPGPRAPAELWRRAEQWKVRVERPLMGEIWTTA